MSDVSGSQRDAARRDVATEHGVEVAVSVCAIPPLSTTHQALPPKPRPTVRRREHRRARHAGSPAQLTSDRPQFAVFRSRCVVMPQTHYSTKDRYVHRCRQVGQDP
jgi:hypothetical protein